MGFGADGSWLLFPGTEGAGSTPTVSNDLALGAVEKSRIG